MKPPSISVTSGDGLEDRLLLAIARTLCTLDRAMIQIIQKISAAILAGRLNANDPDAMNEAREELSMVTIIDGQLNSIKLGAALFHPSYLEERIFITIWQKAVNILRQLLPHELAPDQPPDNTQAYSEYLSLMEAEAENLTEQIVHAASKGSLTPNALLTLEERWVRLDEILDWRKDRYGVARMLQSWYVPKVEK